MNEIEFREAVMRGLLAEGENDQLTDEEAQSVGEAWLEGELVSAAVAAIVHVRWMASW